MFAANSLCLGLVDFIYVLCFLPRGNRPSVRLALWNHRGSKQHVFKPTRELNVGCKKTSCFSPNGCEQKKKMSSWNAFDKCLWFQSLRGVKRSSRLLVRIAVNPWPEPHLPLAWSPSSPTKPHTLPCTTRANHNLSRGEEKKKKKDSRVDLPLSFAVSRPPPRSDQISKVTANAG